LLCSGLLSHSLCSVFFPTILLFTIKFSPILSL
jgi:hypothetical protein